MAELNIADVISPVSSSKGMGIREPKVEQLLAKLKRLQQEWPSQSVQSVRDIDHIYDKQVLEEEIQEIKSVSESLAKELETLQTESYQVEVIQKEKRELFQKLQYLCKESEQDFARRLKHNKSTEELSEQYNCEIQAIKLKHRKLRMKFENHLYQLIEQQKNLYSVFVPDRLPAEIDRAENTKGQLLTTEQLKVTLVSSLEEEIEKRKQEKQDALPVAVQEE